jgi:indolepyruvate ferredoxin oxidoreductase
MSLAKVSLDDKYALERGRIFASGLQALVRLPLEQARRDALAGLDTAGFVSGYRGSPLGGLDQQLWRARAHLERQRIHFQPGLNEELALTAVWGTQMLEASPGARHQGVFSLWYGKAPGLDRAGDALKHGNAAGTARNGGVLVVAGDDHECKSSTLPSQSEYAFMDAGVPVLNPASVQEALDYGLYGWALSRFAGCWVGLVALADTMDSSATILADADRVRIRAPQLDTLPGARHFRVGMSPLEQEELVHGARLDAARAFARANHLDRTLIDAPDARIGIVTTGKACLDVLQALDDLGLDPQRRGIRVYKVGMPWPLERSGLLEFAQGLTEILVVEEKRGLIESQIKEHLYHAASPRPRVVGKRDERGAPLLATGGALSPGSIALAIARRLPEPLHDERVRERLEELQGGRRALAAAAKMPARQPFYCSGCPHNVSTRLPEGSRGLAGIGCHYMVRWMGRNTDTVSQMGGEGVQWIGQAPFTEEPHVFANLGDGTYFHSGILAIRAAVSAGVDITYKLLFNDAVAMTGGQQLDGRLSVPQLTHQLASEGVQRIAVVADAPDRYPTDTPFATGTTLHDRSALGAVQRELREAGGCSVLIYDQTCAALLRRRRKRGLAPEPSRRVFINEAVCEGCGDCSDRSNCVSIEPVDTEFGRKRRIEQTSCNMDEACLSGLCPALVTVSGGRLRRASGEGPPASLLAALPAVPTVPPEAPWNIVITGIGGSGVVTLGALLGMAAHLEGRGASVLDMTGLAQKGGAVISHVRIGGGPVAAHTPRVPTARAHALIACDLVVAASRDCAVLLDPGGSRCVVNTHLAPTAEFVRNGDVRYDPGALLALVHEHSRELSAVDATRLSSRLLGDGVTTNVFTLGYAFQKGLVPLSVQALERAILLNGVAVEANLRAFRWGRLAAHDEAAVQGTIRAESGSEAPRSTGLEALISGREHELVAYQDAALARRYRAGVEAVRKIEQHLLPGRTALTEAVARSYFSLLACKDEYEVARLYTNGAFEARLSDQFEGDYRIELHLAPPLFARPDPATGRPRKRAYGPWMLRLMKGLARCKRLRGTPFDVFGYTRERRLERRLVTDFETTLRALLHSLSTGNHALAVEIASLPQRIRGFGSVKHAAVLRASAREKELLERFYKHEHVPSPDTDHELEIAVESEGQHDSV